jgi:vacuolar-type H+-ATPase subunit C/Vma6
MTTLDPNVMDALRGLFPQAAIDLGQMYGPAVARMSLAEFAAMVQLLNQKKTADAQAQARAKMTAEELAAEKAVLTPMLAQMANDRADAMDLGTQILMAGLKAAAALALGAGLL